MTANYEEHGFEVRAKELPEACTCCPFWLVNTETLEDGECYITGHVISIGGHQDEERMNDCPIRLEENRDADKWDAYLSIGTPEECRAAMEECKDIRSKAIDDFKKEVKNLIIDLNVIRFKDVDEIAEQLKESR